MYDAILIEAKIVGIDFEGEIYNIENEKIYLYSIVDVCETNFLYCPGPFVETEVFSVFFLYWN